MTSRRRLPGRQLRAELPNHRVWSAGRRISLATLAARSPGIPGLLSTCRTAPAAPTSPMPSRRTVPAEPPAAGFAHPAGRPLRLHRPLEDERDGICPIFKNKTKKRRSAVRRARPSAETYRLAAGHSRRSRPHTRPVRASAHISKIEEQQQDQRQEQRPGCKAGTPRVGVLCRSRWTTHLQLLQLLQLGARALQCRRRRRLMTARKGSVLDKKSTA